MVEAVTGSVYTLYAWLARAGTADCLSHTMSGRWHGSFGQETHRL